MLCVVIFIVFMVLLPEGGMLRFYLEPARTTWYTTILPALYRPSRKKEPRKKLIMRFARNSEIREWLC